MTTQKPSLTLSHWEHDQIQHKSLQLFCIKAIRSVYHSQRFITGFTFILEPALSSPMVALEKYSQNKQFYMSHTDNESSLTCVRISDNELILHTNIY